MSDVTLKVCGLNDLELAILLSAIGGSHCIIRADTLDQEEVVTQLQNACQTIFRLSCVSLDCTSDLDPVNFPEQVLNSTDNSAVDGSTSVEDSPGIDLDSRPIANVVIARNLDYAPRNVQMQALDLVRTQRIYTHTSMHTSSKVFIFIAVLANDSPLALSTHLNDQFSICHVHESMSRAKQPQRRRSWASFTSMASSLRTNGSANSATSANATFTTAELLDLRSQADSLHMTAEVRSYMRNIIVAARLHRYVTGGISALATTQLSATCRALAVLHGLDYVTPALVDMAVRKTYLHRLVLATVETERTMQWGSDPATVAESLKGVTVADALDAIIANVETPL